MDGSGFALTGNGKKGGKAGIKCWDCPNFKIQYEPIGKISTGIWDFGRAKCTKHDLVVDFPNHRKLKKLECVEEREMKGGEVGEGYTDNRNGCR